MDQRALVAFCEAHHPALVGALSLYCGDRSVAEEIAQEALVRVWRHWSEVSAADNPTAWVHRVAFNLANSWYRKVRVRRRTAERLERIAAPGGTGIDVADAVAVRAAVAGLPERQRQALVLRYYADLPVREVANLMGCQEGTVKALTSQAIRALRATGLEVTE